MQVRTSGQNLSSVNSNPHCQAADSGKVGGGQLALHLKGAPDGVG